MVKVEPTVIVMTCALKSFVGEVLSVTVTVKLYEVGGGLGGVPVNVTAVPPWGPVSHEGRLE
jgi:hypothetical protein